MSNIRSHCSECNNVLSRDSVCPHCTEDLAVNNALPPIFSDTTKYTVMIENCDLKDFKTLKTISNFLNKNIIQIRKMDVVFPLAIFYGEAPHALNVIEKLINANIKYYVEPVFKWQKKDTNGIILLE